MNETNDSNDPPEDGAQDQPQKRVWKPGTRQKLTPDKRSSLAPRDFLPEISCEEAMERYRAYREGTDSRGSVFCLLLHAVEGEHSDDCEVREDKLEELRAEMDARGLID